MTVSFSLNKEFDMELSDTNFSFARKKPTIAIYDKRKNTSYKVASFNSKETFDWVVNMLLKSNVSMKVTSE